VKRKKGVEYLAIVVFAAEPRRQMPPGETALDRLKAFKTKLAKLEMFRAASGGSANAFQPVSVNIYKFVQLKKCFNLRPDAAEQRVKIFFSKITETQMHNPRRRHLDNYSIRKIRVFADDYQLALASEFPDFGIRRTGTQIRDEKKGELR
jgi:hypothetical protein